MASRVPQLELDQQLCFALYDASRAVIRAYGPLLAPLGLTYPQYITMLALWETDEAMTIGSLGDRLHLDSGTLTPLVKRLEQLGLVDRRRDPDDERRVIVTLTRQGRELQADAVDIPRCLQERLQLDIGSLRSLRRDLRDLTAAIEESAPGAPGMPRQAVGTRSK
jgi:DNA-binding MarR family transcriptional regulator